MSRIELSDDVMVCLEDAIAIVNGRSDGPLDLSALASVIIEVGEALCVQLEKNRADEAEKHERIERILGLRERQVDHRTSCNERR